MVLSCRRECTTRSWSCPQATAARIAVATTVVGCGSLLCLLTWPPEVAAACVDVATPAPLLRQPSLITHDTIHKFHELVKHHVYLSVE